MDDTALKKHVAHELRGICEADPDVLADYVVALMKNAPLVSVSVREYCIEHLRDFLGERTEGFVDSLLNWMASAVSYRANEEFKTDFEESFRSVSESECTAESGSEELATRPGALPVAQPRRQLREYSPERGSATRPKRPCASFQRTGRCRWGDACHFAHLPRPAFEPRHKHGNRLLVRNVATDKINLETLGGHFAQFGTVTNVTLFPEQNTAAVQFATAAEAELAFQATEPVLGDPHIKLTWANGAQEPARGRLAVTQEPTRERLQLHTLLHLQRQQQNLLDRQMASQQQLLGELETQGESLSATDRAELMASLGRMQETVKGLQEALKTTTLRMLKLAGTTKPVGPTPAIPVATVERQPAKTSPVLRGGPSALHQQRTRGKSLDLRPTSLRLHPIPAKIGSDVLALQRFLMPYGPILSLVLAEEGRAAIVRYQRHVDALRALEAVSKTDLGEEFEFAWHPLTRTDC